MFLLGFFFGGGGGVTRSGFPGGFRALGCEKDVGLRMVQGSGLFKKVLWPLALLGLRGVGVGLGVMDTGCWVGPQGLSVTA